MVNYPPVRFPVRRWLTKARNRWRASSTSRSAVFRVRFSNAWTAARNVLLREGDHLDGEDVLPGLVISLAELFE